MTFYEAAIRVLEAEGRPLHFQEITEKSIQQNLLSHIGKLPEMTMLSRLLAMARRKADRKVVVTSKDTFALADWALPEEPEALALTAASETPDEELLPPLRPAERHPEPRQENVRVAGRGAERKRWRDEEDGKRKKKRFPPSSEVVFEILSDEATALTPAALLERAREREQIPTDATEQTLLMALLEDNQRRIDAGRRPQFLLDKDSGEVSLERAGAPSEVAPLELQAAFAQALGIPMEEGRPVLPRAAVAAEGQAELGQAQAQLKTAAKEARRAAARALRRRLAEVDVGTFERAVVKLLQADGFRELKVAKRSKEGPLLTARKREGSLELRYAIRLLRGAAAPDRRAVQELRRDVGHYSANVALLVNPADVRGEAKSEATSTGALVFLWCGEALAEKFLDVKVGVTTAVVESYEVDERFFEAMKAEAEESARRREERRDKKEPLPRRERDRERGKGRAREPAAGAEDPSEEPVSAEQAQAQAAPGAPAEPDAQVDTERPAPVPSDEGPEPRGEPEQLEAGEEGDEEELEEAEAFVAGARPAEGAEGTTEQDGRRRRRRRRRGRRGRGSKGQEGEAATAGAASGEAALGAGEPAVAPTEAAPPPAPQPPQAPPPSPGGEGSAE
jgi:ribonuclease E